MCEKELADLRLDEMGFIFQQMYMLKNLTVLDNIILPACQSKKIDESRRETVLRGQALMRKLGIIDIADNDINEVSGGRPYRVEINRLARRIETDGHAGGLGLYISRKLMRKMNGEVFAEIKDGFMCATALFTKA